MLYDISKAVGALAVAFGVTAGASADIKWLETHYNYGTIREDNGPVTGRARFVNTGTEATFVSRVRPSCGCTGASYPHEMIEPGDTATITFTYNPQGRPGRFDKSVKVYIGEQNQLTTLRITGTVVGSKSTLLSSFPIEAGPLRLETDAVTFGEMKQGGTRHMFVNAYNQGGDTIRPAISSSAKGLLVDIAPQAVAPGEVATLSFYVKTAEMPLGPWVDTVTVLAEGRKKEKTQGEEVTVRVRGAVTPDTSRLSAGEIDNGPRAYVLPEFIDFGEVSGTGNLEFEFKVLNDGKMPMRVARVYSESKGVTIKKTPSKIKPGKTGTVKGVLDLSAVEKGAFRVMVNVITDDPLHPERTVNLVGEFRN